MKNLLTTLVSPLLEPLAWLKGALIFLLGPLNLQIAYLLLAIGIDLVFGIQVAKRDKTFKLSILLQKLRQKVIIYSLWIAMFHAFDMVAGLPDTARYAVIVTLAGMEVMSAIKNTAKLGHGALADGLEGLYLALTKNLPHAPKQDATAAPPEPTASEGKGGNNNEQSETKS